MFGATSPRAPATYARFRRATMRPSFAILARFDPASRWPPTVYHSSATTDLDEAMCREVLRHVPRCHAPLRVRGLCPGSFHLHPSGRSTRNLRSSGDAAQLKDRWTIRTWIYNGWDEIWGLALGDYRSPKQQLIHSNRIFREVTT